MVSDSVTSPVDETGPTDPSQVGYIIPKDESQVVFLH